MKFVMIQDTENDTVISLCNKAAVHFAGEVTEYAAAEKAAAAIVATVQSENPVVTGDATRDVLRAAGITAWRTLDDLL